jgi:RND family efflux transporter MFP subunit
MSRAFATQHYVVATILILAITVANITGCHDPDTGANIETTSHTSDPQGVLVEQTEVPRVYVSPGSIVPSQEFRVTSTITGYIQEIAVREGDRIEVGDLLVRIDPSKVKRAVAQAEASVAATRAELEDANVDVRKYRVLVESESISDERLRKAVLRQKRTRADLHKAEAELQAQRADLDYIEIKSPARAQVAKRLMSVGDLSLPGNPILHLESLEAIEFETHVPETILIQLQSGQPVSIQLDGLQREIKGQITAIVQSQDPVTRSGKVKVLLSGLTDVMPGMFGRASFITGSDAYLTVPESSLVTRAGLEGVFIITRGDGVRFVSVRTGAHWGNRRIIHAGLRPEDRILPDPPQSAFD